MSQTLTEWLNERCPETDLRERNGIWYLPNEVCERKLDYMRDNYRVHWGTQNYQSRLYHFSGDIWISASLELVLYNEIKETIVGCATFKASDYYPNTHFDATAKAFCVVNAAMDLGDQFGRFLAQQNVLPEQKQVEKKKMDAVILKKYNNAIIAKDQKTIDEISQHYVTNIED